MEEWLGFTILSHDGELEFVDAKNTQGDLGHTYQDELLIRIKQGMPKDLLGTTVLHEVIHIIELLTNVKFTEREIDCLALGLYSFLKENPHLRETLFTDDHTLEQEEEKEYEEAQEINPYCSWGGRVYHDPIPSSTLTGVEPVLPRDVERGEV